MQYHSKISGYKRMLQIALVVGTFLQYRNTAFAESPQLIAAKTELPPGFDPARHMLVSEIKEGMTGYGVSVFKGTKPERFDVKVLSILRHFNTKGDVILIECKGANMEHSGSVAGMSGSPVYLKDDQGRERMIGAFAYGWPLAKDPVAGVQPIEYMLAIPTKLAVDPINIPLPDDAKKKPPLPTLKQNRSASNSLTDTTPNSGQWALDNYIPILARQLKTRSQPGQQKMERVGRVHDAASNSIDPSAMQPLTTPLMISGIQPGSISQMNSLISPFGMIATSASGPAENNGNVAAPAFEPGGVLAVVLMTGDSEMTALGTVTEVIGDRVMGFGHPFNNEGAVSLPMGTGKVNAVISTLNTSFKLGSFTKLAGTLQADHSTGVAGTIGKSPAMAPVEIKVSFDKNSDSKTYHFNIANHPKLTPLLAGAALTAAVTGSHELPQLHTTDYELDVEFSNGKKLHLGNRVFNSMIPEIAEELSAPIMALSLNPYEKVTLKSITGSVKVIREVKEAALSSVTTQRLKYKAGETVRLHVVTRRYRNTDQTSMIDFELPKDIADGNYQLVITDAAQYLEGEKILRPMRFTAGNINAVFTGLQDLLSIRRNALYMQLVRKADGIALGRTALPHLPASRRDVFTLSKNTNVTTYVTSNLKIIPTEDVMEGSTSLAITIDHQLKVQ